MVDVMRGCHAWSCCSTAFLWRHFKMFSGRIIDYGACVYMACGHSH